MDAAGIARVRERCNALQEAVADFLGRAPIARPLAWSALGYPVAERGEHAIFPMVVLPATGGGAGSEDDLDALANALRRDWGFRYGGHDFRVGTFADNDEWGKRELRTVLDETGARRPIWWQIGAHIVVFAAVHGAGREKTSLALHVVPAQWVREGNVVTPTRKRELSHARRITRTVAAADFRWDAAAFAEQPGELWVSERKPG